MALDKLDPETRALKRAKYYTGLLWHAGAFIIINAFFWILDSFGAGGINWAYWITLMWGFGLAFHALAYLIEGRQLEQRKSEQYLKREQQNTAHKE